MESRKVQLTGGSTYTVSLPKEWATRNDITAGSNVSFFGNDDHLVLVPSEDTNQTSGTLDISSLDGDRLTRAVMTMYVSGFDVITLQGTRISPDQRHAIRKATQNLVGVEVLEETTDHIVIQDLLDSSELSIDDTISRMHLIATSMLEDSITALAENDDALANAIIERDDDIDRLWFVVSRTFRDTLRSPSAAEELGIPREVCFDYHTSARQLERIGDHAAKISQLTLSLDQLSDDVIEAFSTLHNESAQIITTAMDALFESDSDIATELANDSQQAILSVDKHTRDIDEMLRTLEPHHAQHLGLIADSLSRCADYGGNIAETALQKAAPNP